jgi:hypothetical protein
MQYLMLVCIDPTLSDQPEPASPPVVVDPEVDVEDWVTWAESSGTRLDGDRMAELADGASVRVRGGETLRTDGPFAEAHELIAGFDLLECADLDEAIAVALRHPMAREGAIELRPLVPLRGE